MYTTLLSLLPFMAVSVNAHGYITSPKARQPGTQFGAVCGSQTLSQQTSDIFGNIQGELQVVGSSFDASKCNLWQCKGFQFADQPESNVQKYTAGQVVPIHFDIRAPHDGVANVSIVDTASNSIISTLKSFSQFALTSRPIQSAETDFNITIPTNLGGKCSTAGECVIQMFWDARSVDQTYESCIDFVVGGQTSGGAGATPSRASSAIASTSRPAAQTSGSVEVTKTPEGNTQVVATTTGRPAASSAATGLIYTMTAGSSTLLCREEL